MTHRQISYLKSGIRILGYLALGVNLTVGIILLVGSEGLGILEEVDENGN